MVFYLGDRVAQLRDIGTVLRLLKTMGTSGVIQNAFCFMKRSWGYEGQRAGCGGLMRNVSHRLTYLDMWSPAGGTVWGRLWNFQEAHRWQVT